MSIERNFSWRPNLASEVKFVYQLLEVFTQAVIFQLLIWRDDLLVESIILRPGKLPEPFLDEREFHLQGVLR